VEDFDVDQYRDGFYVGQVRLNMNNQRVVFVTHVEVLTDTCLQPKLTISVADLLDDRDIYWISPRKLGEPLNEMEVIAWAARGST
jgi:hypothetical protein